MRTIRRKVPARITTMYVCDICNAGYPSRKQAKGCNSKPAEVQIFSVGDKVTWREVKECTNSRRYYLNGRVRNVTGPVLPDEEENLKWLGGRLANLHVYQYEVDWTCPYCHREISSLFYGIELMRTVAGMPFRNCKKMLRLLKENGMFSEK